MSILRHNWKTLKPRNRLAEILLAAFIAYLVAMLFGITKDWPSFPVAKVTFFFVFSVVSPFLAPIREPIFSLWTLGLVAIYISTVRWVPAPLRLVALALVSVGWLVYGMLCITVFTGGA